MYCAITYSLSYVRNVSIISAGYFISFNTWIALFLVLMSVKTISITKEMARIQGILV